MNIDVLIANEFSRNIGLLSEHEQAQLLQARVAVVGAGGVGGLHILTLARLGLGKFNIADPDNFEAANVSRQFGAANSTYGRNKADVLADMVKDINLQAEVTVFTRSADKVDEAKRNGADHVVLSTDAAQMKQAAEIFPPEF